MRQILIAAVLVLLLASVSYAEVLIPGWWDASVDDLQKAREWILERKAGVPETNVNILFDNWLESDEEVITSSVGQIEGQIKAKGGSLPTAIPTYTPIPTWTPVPSPTVDNPIQYQIMPTIPAERVKDITAYSEVPFCSEFNCLIPRGCTEIDIRDVVESSFDIDEANINLKAYSNIAGASDLIKADYSITPPEGTQLELLLLLEADFKDSEVKALLNDITISELFSFLGALDFNIQDIGGTTVAREINGLKVAEIKYSYVEDEVTLSIGAFLFCYNEKLYFFMFVSTSLLEDECLDVLYMSGSKLFGYSSSNQNGFINKNNVNVRNEPNQNSLKIDTLGEKTPVTILEEDRSGWYKVQYNGFKTGYVRSDLVTIVGSLVNTFTNSDGLSWKSIVGEAENPVFVNNATLSITHQGIDNDTFEFTREVPCIANDNLYVFLDVKFTSNIQVEWRDFGNATILGGSDNNIRIPMTVMSSSKKPKKGEKHQVVFIVPLGGVQNKRPSSVCIEPTIFTGSGKKNDSFSITFAFSWM